jgi:hypothetical protein
VPAFKNRIVVKMAKNLSAFLHLETGLVRGPVPDYKKMLKESQNRAEQAERREKELRGHLAAKNEQVTKLQNRLRVLAQTGTLEEKIPRFFMVGRGRSGTTWLMRVLDVHPEILCKGEGQFFDRNFRREDFRELHPRLKPSSLYNAIVGPGLLRDWVERSVWAVPGDKERHLDNLTRMATEYFLAHRLSRSGKRIVGDKTPFMSGKSTQEMVNISDEAGDGNGDEASYNGAEVLKEIAYLSPEAKVIHPIRDGRDVAVSVMHFMWSRSRDEGWYYELDDEERNKRDAYREDPLSLASEGIFTEKRLSAIARGWRAEVSEAMERGPKILGDRYIEVRYEALLEKPAEEVSRLLKFLGAEEAGTQAAKECLEAAESARLAKNEEKKSSAAVTFRKGLSGDWRNVFTDKDREIFKEHAGDLLIELGYENGDDW